jgi:hypothetical protein
VSAILVRKGRKASLAQSVERETLNLKVAGSTPAWGLVDSSFAAWVCWAVSRAATGCFCWVLVLRAGWGVGVFWLCLS